MTLEENNRSIQETLYLLSIPGIRDSILKASEESLKNCVSVDEVEWEK